MNSKEVRNESYEMNGKAWGTLDSGCAGAGM